MKTEQYLKENIDVLRAFWLDRCPEEAGEYTFSPEHTARMEALVEQCDRRDRPFSFRRLYKTAAIAAILMSLTCTMVFALPIGPLQSFGNTLLSWTQQMFPLYTQFRYEPVGVFAAGDHIIEIGWIPEGFVEVMREEQDWLVDIYYENERKTELNICFYIVDASSSPNLQLDTEDAEVENMEINETPAFLIEEDDRRMLHWMIDNYICTVMGKISENNIVKIAKNINIKLVN